MSSKTVTAKYTMQGEEFEILVDADLAYEYITGKRQDPMIALQADEIFKNANKGERQTQEKIKKIFGTVELAKVVEIILKKGTVPLTTEQKNKMLEDKRKQIVTIIAKNAMDPRTKAPHPVQRIENAMNEAKISIDPFKSANEQVETIIKKLSITLPIKFANVRVEVTISADSASRCFGLLKQYGLKSENWQSNGSLNAVVEFPAGMQAEFFDKLNGLTHGTAQTKILEI